MRGGASPVPGREQVLTPPLPQPLPNNTNLQKAEISQSLLYRGPVDPANWFGVRKGFPNLGYIQVCAGQVGCWGAGGATAWAGPDCAGPPEPPADPAAAGVRGHGVPVPGVPPPPAPAGPAARPGCLCRWHPPAARPGPAQLPQVLCQLLLLQIWAGGEAGLYPRVLRGQDPAAGGPWQGFCYVQA